MTELILAFLPIIVIIVLLILILTQGYVKAPPDHAYIISGIRKEPRVLIGRAGLKIPFFEQLDKLYLGQITVDIKTDEYIPTNDFINVMVDAVAKVRVAEDPERMKLAMRNFLNKEPAKIAADLQDSLQCKYTGGTVLHLYLGEQIRDIEVAKALIRKVFTNYKLPYISLTPTFSVCPEHGYITGEVFTCPECGGEAEVWSRVVGYLRPVQNFHRGKRQEYAERVKYVIKDEQLCASQD